MVLTVSFVLSPAIGLFVAVTGAMRKHRRQFDASVEASRPHDFAVRVSCARLAHARVHRIPRPTFVTIAKRPSFRGRDARIDKAVSTCSRSKLFLQRGLDDPNQLETAFEFGVLEHSRNARRLLDHPPVMMGTCVRKDDGKDAMPSGRLVLATVGLNVAGTPRHSNVIAHVPQLLTSLARLQLSPVLRLVVL